MLHTKAIFSVMVVAKMLVIETKVIKTGPDRPVQPVGPGTGPISGPDDHEYRSV
jgi:hypothetical protein